MREKSVTGHNAANLLVCPVAQRYWLPEGEKTMQASRGPKVQRGLVRHCHKGATKVSENTKESTAVAILLLSSMKLFQSQPAQTMVPASQAK